MGSSWLTYSARDMMQSIIMTHEDAAFRSASLFRFSALTHGCAIAAERKAVRESYQEKIVSPL